MKETKFSKARLHGLNGGVRSPRCKTWNTMSYNVGLIILAGGFALVLMIYRENAEGSTGLIDDFTRMISPAVEEKQWNYSSYSFQPNVPDWDEQRAAWMEEHPGMRLREGKRPRVLMVTRSPEVPCGPSVVSQMLLRAAKNKMDYCRMHDMELYYSMSNPDPEFSDCWLKLPLIRMLMLQHPEAEWIWWLDADTIFTDLSFEPPFAELESHNMVLYGDDHLVYSARDWTGLSTANYMIRNCQWSLDLLDAWASMGTTNVREESGKFQSELLVNWPSESPGDDRSSLVSMLTQDKGMRVGKQRWAPKVKLVKETEYSMNANWTVVGPKLEELSLDEHQPVPFVTHFAGCLPSCTVPEPEPSGQPLNAACKEQLERAFDFADNQVYTQLGFQPRKLSGSLEPLTKNSTEAAGSGEDTVTKGKGEKEFRILPKLTDWNERRRAWMEKHPPTKKDEVLLVSGTSPKICAGQVGSHMLVRGLKNLIDYGRTNDIRIFYNNAIVDKNLTGWWIKLPLVKILMLHNPSVEWIWWLDSDAVFTNMEFNIPFASYDAGGYNLVMYGSEHELYVKKSFIGINTGNFLIRNCQWSLDFLDRWASLGASKALRAKNAQVIHDVLSDRTDEWDADDQSGLAYLLVTDREKWASRVRLENVFVMSGAWQYWLERFERDERMAPENRPFVTHFAGCKPCQEVVGENCLSGMDKIYNFADNQVLEKYGFHHKHRNSSTLEKSSLFISALPPLEGQHTVVNNPEARDSVETAKMLPAQEGSVKQNMEAPTEVVQEVDLSTKDEKISTFQEDLPQIQKPGFRGSGGGHIARPKEEKLTSMKDQGRLRAGQAK